MTRTPQELMQLALEAQARAYCPYSGFAVGAALLCVDGSVYQGCNIENAAFSPTTCGERTAFFKAVYDGQREFSAIAVVGGRAGRAPEREFPPCGVCRQVMQEFCGPDFRIFLGTGPESFRTLTLEALLPGGFSAASHMK